jgi:hypothetical protein
MRGQFAPSDEYVVLLVRSPKDPMRPGGPRLRRWSAKGVSLTELRDRSEAPTAAGDAEIRMVWGGRDQRASERPYGVLMNSRR